MARDSASVAITMGVDIPALQERLGTSALDALQRRADAVQESIQQLWRGWEYKSAPEKARGRSGAAWKTRIQATARLRSVLVENKARSFYGRKPYTAFVHRAGDSTLEWTRVRDLLVRQHWPAMREELAAAIRHDIATGARGPKKKVRENKATRFRRATFTG